MAKNERVVIELLPCELTPEELLAKGRELVVALEDAAGIEAERRDALAAFAERRKQAEGRVAVLSEAIRNGKELREVEVTETLDAKRRKVARQRRDTGEALPERDATAEDVQGKLIGSED